MLIRLLSCLVLFTISSAAFAADWKPAPAPLMTKWGKEVKPDNAWKEYPRPQLVRKDWLNLNGLWDYAIATQGLGQPPSWDGKILVPYPIESALSGVGKTVTPKQVLWYSRTFEVPDAWFGKQVLLHFDAVDWETTVFVNGKELGVHRGGSDPFSFDVTDVLKKDGKNELVVRVWDPTDTGAQPRGKQVSKPGGIWYTPVTGIWQTVWLEPVNKAAYITGLKIVPNLDKGQVSIDIAVCADSDKISTSVEILDGDKVVDTSRGAGNGHVLTIMNAKHWTPDSPHLYKLRVRASGEKADSKDEVESYFAFRTIDMATDEKGIMRMRLNGKPEFQYGPLDQGWWPDGLLTPPSDAAMKYDLEVLKKLGFNMLRKHIKVEPSRYYYHCDKLGILVWQDMPSGGIPARGQHIRADAPQDARFTEADKKQFRVELKAMIDHLRFFQCIVVWVPFNEGWGQHDTNDILKWVKEYDPTRLVNGPSGWTDRGYGDMKDAHIYPGPGMFPVMKDRVSVLGEFGGLGLPLKNHLWKDKDNWGYATYKTEQELRDNYRLLMRRMHPLIEKGLGAAVYTQTTDVEVEVNGLMTYDREVIKFDVAETAKWHKALFGPPPEQRVLLATSEKEGQKWRWTTTRPAKDWEKPEFDASKWKEDIGGFGLEGTPGAIVRTNWTTTDIWLRRSFELKEVPTSDVILRFHHDDYPEVYINGVQILKLQTFTVAYTDYYLSAESLKALKKGTNVIAIHVFDTGGGRYVDAGLMELVEKK